MDPVYMPPILQDGKLRFILLVMLMLISGPGGGEGAGKPRLCVLYALCTAGLGETAPLLLSELCRGFADHRRQSLEYWISSASYPLNWRREVLENDLHPVMEA